MTAGPAQPSARSDAARYLHHDIDRIDSDYREQHKREPTKPELVLLLAREYIQARLKRGERQ